MQTLAEAQDTNRRLNRRLGSVEAELHSLTSKAFDQVHEAQKAMMLAMDRYAGAQSTIQWQRDKIKALEDRRDEKRFGGWLLFLWALAATALAAWFYWH